jgi:membrane protease subunit HflK
MNIDDILFGRKSEFRDAVMDRANATLEEMKTGIALVGLDLLRPRVPADVLPSFNAVSEAHNARDQKIKEAESYENEILPGARGEARKIAKEGETYKERTIASAKADADYIDMLHKKYKKGSRELDVFLRQHRIKVLDNVLSRVKSKYLVPHGAGGTDSNLWLLLSKDPKDLEPEEKKEEEETH